MKRLTAYLLPTALLALSACNSNDPSDPAENNVEWNIVTYEGTENSVSTFTYQLLNDSPLITLTAEGKPTTPLDKGQRLLAGYINPTPGESNKVTIKAMAKTFGPELLEIERQPASMGDAIYVASVWRTGKWLNLHAAINTSNGDTNGKVTLSVDKATIGNDYPDLYVIYKPSDQGTELIQKDAYGSWDIESVWQLESTKGLIVHFYSLNVPSNQQKLDKDVAAEITPES